MKEFLNKKDYSVTMTEYLRDGEPRELVPIQTIGKELSQNYEELSNEQIETVVDVMSQRYGSETYIPPESVSLEEKINDAVEITIEDIEDSPIYADPSAGDGEHLCVTWGNLGGELAPEGKAEDGEGENLFGIR